MYLEIMFSGFGGQGILSIAKLLAHGAIESGFNVTWLPSYGPEMRGGTASCSVIISDKKISSPFVVKPKFMVAMNQPSFDKYEDSVSSYGNLLFNSDIIKKNYLRTDIKYFDIPIQTMAKVISNRVGNMIMLGSLIKCLKDIPFEKILDALKKHSSKKMVIADNEKALELGYNFL